MKKKKKQFQRVLEDHQVHQHRFNQSSGREGKVGQGERMFDKMTARYFPDFMENKTP